MDQVWGQEGENAPSTLACRRGDTGVRGTRGGGSVRVPGAPAESPTTPGGLSHQLTLPRTGFSQLREAAALGRSPAELTLPASCLRMGTGRPARTTGLDTAGQQGRGCSRSSPGPRRGDPEPRTGVVRGISLGESPRPGQQGAKGLRSPVLPGPKALLAFLHLSRQSPLTLRATLNSRILAGYSFPLHREREAPSVHS